ncbi:Mating-type M-specific polypeptide Mc Short=mat-Mc [Rhizoctonia solani AG-1 IB]|uniref:Mating-type M-specific polypeptide Mc Short=mat-Mc n=1 Tax=Thanatephorus cucumeris (strain AG1-IB / isolate 7/3/14) TaxID=1108050 RepID=M5CD76_THACB|nr:Mating-type M-specific polypeptide Mc Short=mat-Mc [Rhizoctonia solani AG-1 IB]
MPPTRPDRQRAPASSSNTTTATGTSAGSGKAQPPRPPNAWILYRSDKLKELATQQTSGPRKPQAEISKIISQMWQQEGPDTKGRYEARAEAKKAEHAALYPDYKFAPMKKEDKAMLRKAQRLEKEEIRQAERTRKKRKGKGRADEDDDDDEEPPFQQLPYPLQQRPAQSWYPPSTYGPQSQAPALQYPQHPDPRVPPPHDDQAAFAAAGWSTAVDPQGRADDAPFRADAYQQQQDGYADEEEWAGEEGVCAGEEAWAGRSRRGAVWDEEQIAGPSQQQGPVGQWTSNSTTPPPQNQPQSLTFMVPAVLGPSEEPYTFNIDFDMPMASFSGDPDANVAISLNGMNINESSSSTNHVGLNDLLRAPLPDIDVSFPEFVGNADGRGSFDVLSTENEEWWSALMDAAIVSGDRSHADPGPSQLMQSQPMAGPLYEPVAGPSHHQSVAGPSSHQQRPAPIHTQSLPTFAHGLPSPDGDHHQGGRSRAASSAAYPGQTPGAFPEPPYQDSYQPQPQQQQYHQAPPAPQQPEYNPSPFAQIASSRSNPGWRQPQQQQQQQQRNRAPSFPAPAPAFPNQQQFSSGAPFPSPSGAAQFPSPSGAGAFPSPSGAGAFPSPSGAMPHRHSHSFPHQRHVPPPPPPTRPPPPFFSPPDKGKEKDPEAFDFSGWGSQYAAQPPTPAEDAVRRGVGVSH